MNLLQFSDFTFDSRKVVSGSVFFALQTGVRDGNDFAEDAFKKGAKFLILNRKPNFQIRKEFYCIVPDSLQFISNLAKQKFEILQNQGVKTIALTGSVGKTTMKDFLIFLLKKLGKKVFGTEGNFNNHIGLPLTILNSPFEIDFLILEMGMNNPLEISSLIKIAPAEVRIITNISKAHIGNFEEGLFGIAKAKFEILENSNSKTSFITIPNLIFFEELIKNFSGKVLFCEKFENIHYSKFQTFFTYKGKEFFLNKIATETWLSSFLIGFKVLEVFELKLPDDISDFQISEGRGNEILLSNKTLLIDESYNASPDSMINAIKSLQLYKGKKLLIIGGMKELGSQSQKEHLAISQFILTIPEIDVIFVGDEFSFLKDKKIWFSSPENLIQNFTIENCLNYQVILVKASNSSALWKFVNYIKN